MKFHEGMRQVEAQIKNNYLTLHRKFIKDKMKFRMKNRTS